MGAGYGRQEPDCSFDQARATARALGTARRGHGLLLPPSAALGAVLAAPLQAWSDVPAGDASAMDGFAVTGSGPWQVHGLVLAGGRPADRIAAGEAVEVATGALVPPGTERVLPVEIVREVDGPTGRVVQLEGPPTDRRHVRSRGEECTAGEELLPAGRRVTASVVGLAESTGSDTILVRPRPRVAALVTGDELLLAGLPQPGQVRDAVGPLLPGAVASLGGELMTVARCGDGPVELEDALERLADLDCDVVVTCGMAGAGPADRLRPWLQEVGAELLVDGVAVRPGHPQVLAVLPGGRPIVGLPGNPLAAVAALLGLMHPLLDGMAGLEPPVQRRAELHGWEPRGRPVTSLVPVRWAVDGTVEPSGPAGPAQLRGLAAADCVAVVPGDWDRTSAVELLPRP